MTKLMLALTILALGGCAATFEPFDYDTMTPKVVEVDLDSKGPGRFSLIVKNIGDQPLTVHRDQITLHTVKGARLPLTSSAGDLLVVAPGGAEPVDVRYETKDLPMYSMVALHFDHAFGVDNTSVASPSPMNFRVGQRGPWSHNGPFDCCLKEPVAK